MKPTLRISRAAAPAVTALLLSAAASSAQAVLLTIDPALSSVTYTFGGMVFCDADGNCPESPAPRAFALSGSFEVERTMQFIYYSIYPPEGYYRDEIRFRSVSIDSGGAAQLGFSFPTYFAVADEEAFAGNENACTWFPSMGSCMSMGFFGWFSGEFDGRALTMTGTDFSEHYYFPDQFNFTIVANAVEPANVPAPDTLACLAAAALGLGAARRRRVSAGD